MGLGKDTNTSPSQFSHLALVFYVSYLAFEPVMAYLLQKLPVAKVLGANGMYLRKTKVNTFSSPVQ